MNTAHYSAMTRTIELAARTRTEDDSPRHPRVAALLMQDGTIRGEAFKGELKPGDHAEFTLLEHKLKGKDLRGATLFTTLEPCTRRNAPKVPCADRVVSRGIKHVFVGMIDPDPRITLVGVRRLREAGVEVQYFPMELADELRSLNSEFIEDRLSQSEPLALREPALRSLDDWYYSLSSIYLNSNYPRPIELLYTHLVESAEGLREAYRRRSEDTSDVLRMLVKTIAWWMAVCAKAGLRSVEDVVWLKYPHVCAYCRLGEHDPKRCKEAGESGREPDWGELFELGVSNSQRRPASLSAWRTMFRQIYPPGAFLEASARLGEEIGELAQSIRLYSLAPQNLLGEVADVFAWLMHIANSIEDEGGDLVNAGPWLELAMSRTYPDACSSCGNGRCICPPVTSASAMKMTSNGPSFSKIPAASYFLSPSEMLGQFHDAAERIEVAGRELDPRERDFRNSVYATSIQVLERISDLGLSPIVAGEIDRSARFLFRMNAAQHLTQHAVDDFLRALAPLTQEERSSLREQLRCTAYGPWQSYLVELLQGPE